MNIGYLSKNVIFTMVIIYLYPNYHRRDTIKVNHDIPYVFSLIYYFL